MTFYVTVIFEDPAMDDHGYTVESLTNSVGCNNGIWTIEYIDDGKPEKKNVVAYNQLDVFSVIINEE